MKRTLIIAVLFLAVLGLVFWFRLRREQARQPGPAAPQTTNQTLPAFPTLAAAAQPSYALALPAPSFPGSLPAFTLAPAASLQGQFPVVARALGFSGDPRVVVGSSGSYSLWTKGQASLTMGGDPAEINYVSGAAAASAVTSPVTVLESAADQFFKKIGLGNTGLSLVRDELSYFVETGNLLKKAPGPPEATVARLSYRYLLADRPLLAGRIAGSGLWVNLNAGGEVVSATGYYWSSGLIKQSGSVNIINYSSATARLLNNQGVLVSLASTTDFGAEALPQYSVSASSISSVILGYYYAPGNSSLWPVYVFEGKGADADTGNTVSTTTVVSALP